jgi:hypothetical protein
VHLKGTPIPEPALALVRCIWVACGGGCVVVDVVVHVVLVLVVVRVLVAVLLVVPAAGAGSGATPAKPTGLEEEEGVGAGRTNAETFTS